MGTTYRAVKGSKLTEAEGDDSREWTSEAGIKTAAEDLTFDRSGGWIHGGTGDLVTVGVTIDESVGISKAGVTGARPGTWVMFYYSGAVNPTITGASGTVTPYHNITTAGTYECWLAHKGNGDYSLSIPQAGGSAGDTTPPVISAMSVEDASPNDLVVTLNSACTFTNIGYTFRVNAVARTLTSVTGNGTNTMTFLISGAAITDTDVLDLAYDSTTGDTIKSSNSIELVTFTATTVTNNTGAGYVFDTYGQGITGISFQKLAAASTNACIVTKDDVTFETVILEDSGSITTSSLIVSGGTLGAWASTDDVFISEMINQGTGANWTQGTLANMPRLMSGGVIDTTSAMAAMNYLGTDDRFFETPRVFVTDTWSIHAVFELTDLTGVQSILAQTPGSAVIGRAELIQFADSDLTRIGFFNNGASHVLNYSTNWTTGQKFIANYADGGTYKWQENAGAFETLLTGESLTTIDKVTTLGTQKETTTYANSFRGKFQELLVWDTNQEVNRAAIKAGQEARY